MCATHHAGVADDSPDLLTSRCSDSSSFSPSFFANIKSTLGFLISLLETGLFSHPSTRFTSHTIKHSIGKCGALWREPDPISLRFLWSKMFLLLQTENLLIHHLPFDKRRFISFEFVSWLCFLGNFSFEVSYRIVVTGILKFLGEIEAIEELKLKIWHFRCNHINRSIIIYNLRFFF